MAQDLAGRVALVTGAGQGLGKAIAHTLGAAGAKVFLVGRNEDKLGKSRDELRTAGVGCEVLAVDLVVPDSAHKAISRCVASFGRLDVLVNSAGVFVWRKFLELTDADWQRTIDTNLAAPFRLTQAAGRVFERQGFGGSVINIASIHGRVSDPNVVPQVAAKAGLLGLTQACAEALRGFGVRVNAVSPGAIEPESAGTLSVDLTHKITQADVAQVVLFLASDAARGITGSLIDASGITRPVIAGG